MKRNPARRWRLGYKPERSAAVGANSTTPFALPIPRAPLKLFLLALLSEGFVYQLDNPENNQNDPPESKANTNKGQNEIEEKFDHFRNLQNSERFT